MSAKNFPAYKRGRWAKLFDGDNHKRYYFYNVKTKESRWTEPPEWAAKAHLEIVVPPEGSSNSTKKVKQTVRVNLGSTSTRNAGGNQKVRIKLDDGVTVTKTKQKKKSKLDPNYCSVCDVRVTNPNQMALHKSGKKHKAAMDLFRRTGKLPGNSNVVVRMKKGAKGAVGRVTAACIDPKKKAERANRFQSEYIEKVHYGIEDNSHRRIKVGTRARSSWVRIWSHSLLLRPRWRFNQFTPTQCGLILVISLKNKTVSSRPGVATKLPITPMKPSRSCWSVSARL